MSDKARRKLLKSIAAGSGAVFAGNKLPESWSRPVVNSVLLPAHAQTSVYGYSLQQTIASVAPMESNLLLAALVNDAHAGADVGSDNVAYCVDVDGQTWRAAIRRTTGGGCPIASWWVDGGTVGGSALEMNASFCGPFDHPPITFQVISRDDTEVIVEILEDGSPSPITSIPIGTCPFGDPTADQCCEIAGTYCGGVENSPTTLVFEISADGSIAVTRNGNPQGTLDTQVDPYCGGDFSGVTPDPFNRTYTGTVECGSGTITGTEQDFPFTATIANCID
jgi:hypothetical protein